MAIQQIEMLTVKKEGAIEPRTLVFMSSLSDEGKTVNAGSIAWKLKKQGKKVIFLSFSRESLHQNEINQIGYPSSTSQSSSSTAKPRGAYGIFRFIPRLLGYPDTRINPDSPFLQKPEIYLDSLEYFIYEVDNNYFKAGNFRDLIADRFNTAFFDKPDYVLIELPPFLYYSYPQQLVANADLAIVVCRANREWSHADQGAFDVLKKITSQEPVVLLNGIELLVIESVLGDLPKKRSWFRRTAKKIIRLQFYSRYKH